MIVLMKPFSAFLYLPVSCLLKDSACGFGIKRLEDPNENWKSLADNCEFSKVLKKFLQTFPIFWPIDHFEALKFKVQTFECPYEDCPKLFCFFI